MPSTLPATTAAILEKAAIDNGFELELPAHARWLVFGSTSAPLKIWLTQDTEGGPIVALSRLDVAAALEDGVASHADLPDGATTSRQVRDAASLHRLVRRAWQLARSLPDEPLVAFQKQTAALPRATEAERLVVERVGQNIFRERLLEYWQGRCAVTGLAEPALLRASHIKPWADCATDAERLDVFNGLLLAPHLDAAFDAGFITIDDGGAVVVSPALRAESRALLGLAGPQRLTSIAPAHRAYLRWHRAGVFRQDAPSSR